MFRIEQGEELDACFTDLGYTEGNYPYEAGWRQDGVTAKMIKRFCERRTDRGEPVICMIIHRNQKIDHFTPPNLRNDDKTPIVLFSIHGDHAYFYSGGKQAASQMVDRSSSSTDETAESETTESGPVDEYSSRWLREPFRQTASIAPPFHTWMHSSMLVTR